MPSGAGRIMHSLFPWRRRPPKPAGAKLFVPPGHFYSPVVDPEEAGRHLARLQSRPVPDRLPGVPLSREELVAEWRALAPLMAEAPFRAERHAHYKYGYTNPAYSWGDASVLHAILRKYRPRRLIEIGSGWSSACSVDTVGHSLDGNCDVTLIEPYPALVQELLGSDISRVKIIESGVQDVPVELFENLRENDVLFIDSTHVVRTGSDVCFELFEILPRLAPGVLVHFHDMFWPFEYPHDWAVEENRSWNEIYAVRAFLTNNADWQIFMFNDYMAKLEHDLIASTYPAFLNNTGGALWLRRCVR
jgi:methyltransferase family protein